MSARDHARIIDAIRLGRLVRMLRARRGWRQEDLATRASLGLATVSLVERGRAERLTPWTLQRLLAPFGASVDIGVRGLGGDVDQNQAMFRRIELIHPAGVFADGDGYPAWKSGLTPTSTAEVADAWTNELPGNTRSLPWNCRLYFTEKGWREVGRNVVAAARRSGQEPRIIAIKKTDAQVVWRDRAKGYEVAVQPRSRRASGRDDANPERDSR